ncbi:YdcF family protein [Terrihabitans rhizophilus]|uniref:YdcF family protein n=1 Tax=Terrihabitans rhizophilus TaxID=3092662 RepID=A0ABU4RPI2_9HYPH|nr:YdcF family protein [Terrihabitans sp. PJ23]MDX6806772.1 YdcF family protein [Terrihabitans sp. PJ23]
MAETATARRRRPSLLARLVRLLLGLALLGGLVLIGGFVLFIQNIPQPAAGSRPMADAIVVLTGGPERIGEAVDLLADGQARRLLISGVNPDTTKAEIARLHPRATRWLDCCMDLGRRALNTAGNAAETRQWVRQNGFQTVIVVTSGWHMRRSLLELQRALPEVIILPHVAGNGTTEQNWWQDSRAARLLVAEYVKYLAALVEVRVAPRLTGRPEGDT